MKIQGNDIDGNWCTISVHLGPNGEAKKVTSEFSQIPYMGFQEMYFSPDPIHPDKVIYNKPEVFLRDLCYLGFIMVTDQDRAAVVSRFVERYGIGF